MADNSPVLIGRDNSANPGAQTLLRRDANSASNDPVLTVRTPVGGDGIHGEASGNSTGVQGTSPSGYGVQGNSTSGVGVRGISDDSDGVKGEASADDVAGVHGENTSTGGDGVRGTNTGGVGVRGISTSAGGVIGESDSGAGVGGRSDTGVGMDGVSSSGFGVRGISTDGEGVRGVSNTSTGVVGYGRHFGVHGVAAGQGSDTDPTVYAGVFGQGGDFGVYCTGPLGLYSESPAGAGGTAGYFKGNVYVDGSFTVFDPRNKSAAVAHPDGTLRRFYTLESPESRFEDFGRAEVIEGHARVELDEDFAALVDTDDYHVFVTSEGVSSGLYVSERTPRDFEVREQGEGTSTLAFSYRIVVKPKDVEAKRLETVERPPVRTLDEVEPPDLEQESQ